MFQRTLFISVVLITLNLSQAACAQDCMGVSLVVKGEVQNSEGEAITNAEIHISNRGAVFSEHFEETLTTDSTGAFQSNSQFMYACDKVHISISAEGYREQSYTYYAPGEGMPDEVPDYITIVLEPIP